MDEPKHSVDDDNERRQSERIELDLLLEGIYLKYGFDFRNYSKASIKRRILRRMALDTIPSLSAMQARVLYDSGFFETLLMDLSISVTEMFRDPSFFRALRSEILPSFSHQSFVKIWHAGCSTGEEVYSMSILLAEEGLSDRTRIYATDLNEKVLSAAREGIYPLKAMDQGNRNYLLAGGKRLLADYYTAKYDHVIFEKELKKNIVFSDHNLAQDSSFGEMDLIVCRNVLIYFDKKLQDRVFSLFEESMAPGGFLCLGSKESMRFAHCYSRFSDAVRDQKIYRKK
jgi:chemotaxis protein methyltransferase CheR